MTHAIQPPETDLALPVPAAGEVWDSHTIHTHYFGFTVPEEQIGVFIYVRCQPVFKLCSGGVCIFRGLDNDKPLDIEHPNFLVTMPFPVFRDGVLETPNGLKIEFIEPGEKVRISYSSGDGRTHFDVVQTAITPLLSRGHVMPGEDVHTNPAQQPGGSEQFMRCSGNLTLEGKDLPVDCYAIRDRSWRQVRTENEVLYPPVGWSPMCFGEHLVFNQVGFEPASTSPAWLGLFDVPGARPSHYFAWVINRGEVRDIVRVKRNVLAYHPTLHAALRQEIEAEDHLGEIYRFRGEALAMANLPSWPNNIFIDSVYRWENDAGEIAYCTYQEAWYHTYQRAMTLRRRKPA